MYVPGAYGNHKRMSGSQELKLQMVGSHAIGVELSHSPLQQQPMLLTTDSHSLIFANKILAHRLGKQKSVPNPTYHAESYSKRLLSDVFSRIHSMRWWLSIFWYLQQLWGHKTPSQSQHFLLRNQLAERPPWCPYDTWSMPTDLLKFSLQR